MQAPVWHGAARMLDVVVSCCYGTRLYLYICICITRLDVLHIACLVSISSVYVQCTHDASQFTFNIPK